MSPKASKRNQNLKIQVDDPNEDVIITKRFRFSICESLTGHRKATSKVSMDSQLLAGLDELDFQMKLKQLIFNPDKSSDYENWTDQG